jgi:hypothetical protein
LLAAAVGTTFGHRRRRSSSSTRYGTSPGACTLLLLHGQRGRESASRHAREGRRHPAPTRRRRPSAGPEHVGVTHEVAARGLSSIGRRSLMLLPQFKDGAPVPRRAPVVGTASASRAAGGAGRAPEDQPRSVLPPQSTRLPPQVTSAHRARRGEQARPVQERPVEAGGKASWTPLISESWLAVGA